MIRAFAVLFFVFVGAAQASTLTCGDLPCADAAEQEVSWPKSELLGLVLRTAPALSFRFRQALSSYRTLEIRSLSFIRMSRVKMPQSFS